MQTGSEPSLELSLTCIFSGESLKQSKFKFPICKIGTIIAYCPYNDVEYQIK